MLSGRTYRKPSPPIRRREASASLRPACRPAVPSERRPYQTPRGVCFFEATTLSGRLRNTAPYQTPRGVCFFEAYAPRLNRVPGMATIRRREASASLRLDTSHDPESLSDSYQTPRGVCFFEAVQRGAPGVPPPLYQTPRGVCFFEAFSARRACVSVRLLSDAERRLLL